MSTSATNDRSARTAALIDSGEMPPHIAWKLFCGMVLAATSFMNMILSVVAITDPSFFATTNAAGKVQLPGTDSLDVYGWIGLLLSVVMFVTAFGVFFGVRWARIVGGVTIAVNAVFQLAFMAAFPIASLVIIVLDVLVLYGLIVRGQPTGYEAGEAFDRRS